jgi:hypothetical protein
MHSMRTSAIVLSLVAVLSTAALIGCGDSGSSTSSTSSATVPTGKLSASSAPVKLGYYAGMDCGGEDKTCPASWSNTSTTSTAFYKAREGYLTACKNGYTAGTSTSYTDSDGVEYNYVCFTAVGPTNSVQMKNFYYAGQKIVSNTHVGSDRWSETCDAGWCTSGEWFGTSRVNGKIRNPNKVYSHYQAVWIAAQ